MADLDLNPHPLQTFIAIAVALAILTAIAAWWLIVPDADEIPPQVPGYYWCSTDERAPVLVWNDGSVDEPHWMVQHLDGPDDNYHQVRDCECHWSPRLTNPFFDARSP